MFRHILAGHDGSAASDRAFGVAVALGRAFQGRVRLVGVAELAPVEALALATEDEQALIGDALARLAASAGSDACPVDFEVVCGVPASVLLEQARQHGVDHIVLGRTGKGIARRLLIGSVSEEVSRRSPVAVTLVP